MEAQFESDCTNCGRKIYQGVQQERTDGGGWHHVVCPEPEQQGDPDQQRGNHQPEAGGGQDNGDQSSEVPAQPEAKPEGGSAESATSVPLTARQKRIAAAQQLLARLQSEEAEAERKRSEADAAREAKRDQALEGARAKHMKRLYAAAGIDAVDSDRGEAKRFAALLAKVGLSEGP